MIVLTIYETDSGVADLSHQQLGLLLQVWRCCVKALFPALMGLVDGLEAISDLQLAFFFPPSTRRLRRFGDGAAGMQRTVHQLRADFMLRSPTASYPQAGLP